MLWLALHLPLLSLEAFSAAALAPVAAPVALIARHRIAAANAVAQARGARVGMKRATALSLAPDLLLGEADAARDAAALRAVAHAALAYTPAVTMQPGQPTVLLEVATSLRLFGGLAMLHGQLREALAPLQHHVCWAAAPTPLGAALLAQWRAEPVPAVSGGTDVDLVFGPHATRLRALQQLLDRIPVWLLGPGREHWEALQGMGLRTLSDLRELPRAGLARRFGEGLLEDLDRALGRAPDPRDWLELPTHFESRLELHQRADSTEPLLVAAGVLLARLVAWGQARHGRIAAFTLAMQHEPRHRSGAQEGARCTELRIELAEPALDAAHLQLLLRERLARTTLPAPTLELRLHCHEIVSGAPPNGELFPTRDSGALGLTRLLERLRARLGDAQVQCVEPVADHRPERSSRSTPARAPAEAAARTAKGTAARRTPRAMPLSSPAKQVLSVPLQPPRFPEPVPHPALPLPRPVWLLPEPLPLAERDSLPLLDGKSLQLLSGPERIEAGWWDGAPAVRDYFIALASDGSLVWLWRSRLPKLTPEGEEESEVQWFLQGRFA